MNKKTVNPDIKLFEHIKQTDDKGNEFWSARDLSKALEYSEYRHFIPVIERAKEVCSNSGQFVDDHFEDILEMILLGKTAQREVGKKVRKTIEELGGTMPENLPIAESIKKLEKGKEPKPLNPKKKP